MEAVSGMDAGEGEDADDGGDSSDSGDEECVIRQKDLIFNPES